MTADSDTLAKEIEAKRAEILRLPVPRMTDSLLHDWRVTFQALKLLGYSIVPREPTDSANG